MGLRATLELHLVLPRAVDLLSPASLPRVFLQQAKTVKQHLEAKATPDQPGER